MRTQEDVTTDATALYEHMLPRVAMIAEKIKPNDRD